VLLLVAGDTLLSGDHTDVPQQRVCQPSGHSSEELVLITCELATAIASSEDVAQRR
jgi:hypothetical protein